MSSWTPEQFWAWFQRNERRFRNLVLPAGEHLLDEIEEHLHRVEPGLGFLVSEQPDELGRYELVLTTHGAPRRLEAVDRLFRAVPAELPGWVVVRLQPPRGFEFTHRANDLGVVLDPKDLRFEPTRRGDDPLALGVRVVARIDPRLTLNDLRTAVTRILATALGDEAFSRIESVQVAFDDPVADELIPLPDLPRFLEWWERRKSG